ncbi:MAG: hypothetical protein R3B55_01445 [Candidatus Paceibacterota bacterium]
MSNGLKIFLIILILVVFGAVAYFLLSDGEYSLNVSPTSAPLQTTDNQPVSGLSAQATADIDADQIGQQFLTQLLNIRSIKLREDIFSRPSFVSLTDFTIELIQLGNEGRVNPFAPFGVDGNTEPFGSFDESQGEFTGDGSSSFGPGSVVPMAPSPMPQDQTPNPNINNS